MNERIFIIIDDAWFGRVHSETENTFRVELFDPILLRSGSMEPSGELKDFDKVDNEYRLFNCTGAFITAYRAIQNERKLETL